MIEEIFLDNLNTRSVCIRKEISVEINGLKKIVEIDRKAIDNNMHDRQYVSEVLESKYRDAIFAVWGDEPTVFQEEI